MVVIIVLRLAEIGIKRVHANATFQNGAMEQTLGQLRHEEMANIFGAAGLTEDGYSVRIASKCGDIFPHPRKRSYLIEQTIVPGGVMQ